MTISLLLLLLGPLLALAQQPAERDQLVDKLIHAGTPDERERLIAGAGSKLNADLCKALIARGDQLSDDSNNDEALSAYEAARSVAEALNDPALQADALYNIADLETGLARFSDALGHYNKSLELRAQLNDQRGIARCHSSLAYIYKQQGDYETARQHVTSALAIGRELGDNAMIAASLNHLASLAYGQGNYPEAIRYYTESLEKYRAVGDKKRLAVVSFNIGNILSATGDFSGALRNYQYALSVNEELGVTENTNHFLLGIGGVYKRLGNFEKALGYEFRALALSQKAQRPRDISETYCAIAAVYEEQGNYNRAAASAKQCLSIIESIGLKDDLADATEDLGRIYLRQGDWRLAFETFQKALASAQQLNQNSEWIEALNWLGTVHYVSGDFADAEQNFTEALSRAESQNDKPGAAHALRNLGRLHLAQGKPEQALDGLRKSLDLWKEMDSKQRIAETLNDLASVYFRQGDYETSLDFANRSMAMAQNIQSPEILWQAMTSAGMSQRALHHADEAAKAFADAIRVIDTLRLQVAGGEEEQQEFFENKLLPYQEMVSLYFEQDNFVQALACAEQAKATVLQDVLQSGRAEVSGAITPAEKQQEQHWLEDMVSLNTQIRNASVKAVRDEASLKDLTERLETARLGYEDFRVALYAAHPELRIQRAELRPLEMQDAVPLLARGENAILEYMVTDAATFLFVLDAAGEDAALKVYRIPIARKALTKQVEAYRSVLAQRDPGFRSPAEALYGLLLKPAEEQLRGKKELVIVPDGELWGLPFQALADAKGRSVLEMFAVSYAPSISVLREMRGKRTQNPVDMLLAFGNPLVSSAPAGEARPSYRDEDLAPLPQAETEVRMLEKLYGSAHSKIFTGADAGESQWKENAERYEVLHLAAHGILDSASPMYSHIVLARPEGSRDDGLLEAWELMQMHLSADLVVLSACETALGRIGAGEGMIGMSWAVFVAGSNASVVSQWKVDSETTARLMVAFHRNLRRGLSKAEALKLAATTLAQDARYRHPFFWAGFVVIGDPSPLPAMNSNHEVSKGTKSTN